MERKDKIENLKRLMNLMESKSDFVEYISKNYKLSYLYVLQNWFQSRWTVPDDKIDDIISMAQKWLFEQTERNRKILIETGFALEKSISNLSR